MNIIGLSVATTEHHAAALVRNGQLIAAAEEERFNRIKHYGARVGARSDSNLINDGQLRLEDVICEDAVRFVLGAGGIRWEEVDRVAINGIPARYSSTYSLTDPTRPPQIVEDGRTLYIPHHLCHAASAFRLSGFSRANILTIDGRGERETAAFFSGEEGGEILRRWDVLCGEGQSFGGCYETASRVLGFGPYGQGSVMALAGMGSSGLDLSSVIAARSHDDYVLDERALQALLQKERTDDTRDSMLAASVQGAIEEAAAALVREAFDRDSAPALCLAGGVTLNCPLNRRLMLESGVERVFAQPAAHDAGTAIGAALEAAALLGEPPAAPMRTAAWGPKYDDATIAETLREAGVSYERHVDITDEVADRLADGQIVCRFDGRMEIGPRALGQRSILADPRRPEMKTRLNAMKGREVWRPFAPSILEEHLDTYLVDPFVSPFMLFTFEVQEERREEVPAVVHVNGTTRPQSVHRKDLPRYAALLEAFRVRTGVPMLLNTSFNCAGEPIVCSPADALASWRSLEADALQMGSFLVEA